MAISDFYKDIVFLNKISSNDGLGGIEFTYVEGAGFKGVITIETNSEIKIAEQEGLKSIYTLSTSKAVKLDLGDLIKSQDKVYKVTSVANELQTPNFSNLDLQQYSLERYQL